MPHPEPVPLSHLLETLKPKDKAPASARVLNAWLAQAQERLSLVGPRLGWLVAATVVCACLQRVVDQEGLTRFLVKGGTMLQYRLPGMTRTTGDVDGLVRGDIDSFMHKLDETLSQPWGALTVVRGPVETINVPNRIIKPRRFFLTVLLNGVTWRRIQVEISPDEGSAGSLPERIAAPSLAGFGLPTPDELVSLSLCYQIAQKIHAVSDPHNPPDQINDRARDVVDLLLLSDLVVTTGLPSLVEILSATRDIFAARADEALAAGLLPRSWPTRLSAYPHWEISFARAAESAGMKVTLAEAVTSVNIWLKQIEAA